VKFEGKGFLYKKKDGMNTWDKRYFSVINKYLYWYMTDHSREPQNKISLDDIETILYVDKPSRFNILVSTKNNKTKAYKFKTENNNNKTQWIDYLEKAITGALYNQINKV
jgi:hypothetical protein